MVVYISQQANEPAAAGDVDAVNVKGKQLTHLDS
jgi:hypothetical protein